MPRPGIHRVIPRLRDRTAILRPPGQAAATRHRPHGQAEVAVAVAEAAAAEVEAVEAIAEAAAAEGNPHIH